MDILLLSVCAVISGAEGWEDIEDFGRLELDWLRQYRPFEPGKPLVNITHSAADMEGAYRFIRNEHIDAKAIAESGFGTTVPVPREDRWGYVRPLLDNGYGEEEIAAADAMNDLLTQIIRYHNEDAWDDLFALKEQYEDAEWFNTVSGSDSMLGFVAEKITHPLANLVPNFGWKLYTRWKKGGNSGAPSFNQTYQPLDTLRQVQSPSLWLLSGEDTSLPTPETVEELTVLQSEGLPIVHKVYPGAEHGNIEYITDENGERTYTRYVPTYFTDVVEWFSEQNAL